MVNPMVLVYERHITSCDLDFHSLQGKENIHSIKINQEFCVGRFSRYPLERFSSESLHYVISLVVIRIVLIPVNEFFSHYFVVDKWRNQ